MADAAQAPAVPVETPVGGEVSAPTAPPVEPAKTEAPAGDPPVTPETPAAPPVEKEPPAASAPDPWDSRFAKLAQAAADVRKKEAAISAQADKIARATKLEELARSNPKALLGELGVNVDELLLAIVDGEQTAPGPDKQVAEALRQIEELKRANEAAKQAHIKAQEDAWWANYHSENRQKVVDAGDRYEALNALGEQDQVSQIIFGFWQQTGEILPFDEAAELAENKALELARKATAIKKLGASASAPLQTKPTTETVGSQNGTPKTLSNNLAAPAPSGKTGGEILSREESLARAVELVKAGRGYGQATA